MQQEERLRVLIREDLERGPVPEARFGRVEHRARRRRAGRRLLSAVLAVSLGVAVLFPLPLLRFLGGASTVSGTQLDRYGIHLRLPRGWEGRFSLSPGRGPVFIAANFPLRSWRPTGVTRAWPQVPYIPASLQGGGRDAVILSLFEYPPDRLSPSDDAFPRLRGRLSIAPGDVKPCALMKEGCVIRYMSIARRNFLLLGTFATVEASANGDVVVGHLRVVPRQVLVGANRVLETLTVDTTGYELGISCQSHGTTLHLSTTTGGVLGWSSPCLAAPADRLLTIHLENRLTTVTGKTGIPARLELYPNEVFAYTVEDQAYGASPDTRRHAVFIGHEVISPGTITYRVPPLAPGVYYMTGRGAGDPTTMNGVLIVGD